MAASAPVKLDMPILKISTETSITLKWSVPSDNGGTPVLDY